MDSMTPDDMMIEVDRREREATYRVRMAVASSEYNRSTTEVMLWVLIIVALVALLMV
jgi:hypothetical protein